MSREVLSPPLQRLSHNRSYRVNMVHEDFGASKWNNTSKQTPTKGYVEQDLYAQDDYEDDAAAENIKELPNGSFQLLLPVPKALYGGIIGLKGNTKKRIESESQTEIHVPRSTDASNELIIKAKERSHVCTALRKLRLLIDSLRKKMRPTHFLSVPLNFGQVKEQYVALKQSILDAQLPGIDEELFQSELRLHLTLGVYVLLDAAERQKAVEQLEFCRKFLSDLSTPFELKIKGLEIMNDDPSSTRILYACLESPELQQFADKCLQHFKTTGLCATDNNERDSIKLHVTLLNNRYRRNANKNSANSFDAREILKRYGDYDFGTAQCNELHLCVMESSRDVEEFYKITSSLKF